ncbi:unnamed protein product [Rotaria sordida]|uniref:Uncharacterized protein n=1 Tax=Rotaria sordida TaxID=392033 RepID=A0A819QGK8_9BILA|nr:unnamed protein product [Rotaria sordida]
MTGCYEESAMIEEYVDELLNTFRTPFWLDECGCSIENLPLEIKNASIKRLDLQRLHGSYDEQQCMKFSHSRLAMQCEELHISVKNRISICYLVKTMPNLRLLHVKCEENEQKQYSIEDNKQDQNSTEDKLVNWLEQQLSGVRSLVEIFGCHGTIVLRIS